MATSQAVAEAAVYELLRYVGENPNREGLRETPARVARAWKELTAGYGQDPRQVLGTTFKEAYDSMVVVRAIPFASLCEHHLLPFHGHATIGYIPDGRVVGLSKLARLVECYARRLQVQERMTEQIAHAVTTVLETKGTGVVVEAYHTCMAMRGVRKEAATVTSSLHGAMLDESPARAEFMGLAHG